jgi:hypothetical protein
VTANLNRPAKRGEEGRANGNAKRRGAAMRWVTRAESQHSILYTSDKFKASLGAGPKSQESRANRSF